MTYFCDPEEEPVVGYQINGVGKVLSIPNILKKKYKYTSFPQPFKMSLEENGKVVEKVIDVPSKIKTAWDFAVSKAAQHKPCNEYFKTLPRKLTLKQVLEEGDICLHLLEPKPGFTYADVPTANAAGRDIGFHPALFLDDAAELACTLIHELAHVGGASTNPDGPNALAAELALKSCLCGKKFSEENLGLARLPSIRLA